MITSVWRAFFHDGSLKAGTPLEMASTPVTAAPPDGEGVQHEERHPTAATPAASSACSGSRAMQLEAAAERGLVDAVADHERHGDDEEVGRDGEDLPGLLHAPEVAEGDDGDEAHGDRHPVGVEPTEHRVRGRPRRPTPTPTP